MEGVRAATRRSPTRMAVRPSGRKRVASPPARSRPHFLGTQGEGRAGAAAEGPTSQGSGSEGGLRSSRPQVPGRGMGASRNGSACASSQPRTSGFEAEILKPG